MERDEAFYEAEDEIRLSVPSIENVDFSHMGLTQLPPSIRKFQSLKSLDLSSNQLFTLPKALGTLRKLENLDLSSNRLSDLPSWFIQFNHLTSLYLYDNPLNPELNAAYTQGLEAVKAYLRAKAAAQITLNEAKLILVGEGEVGKTCLDGCIAR